MGKVTLVEKDFKEVISPAKEGVLSRRKISELTQKLHKAGWRIFDCRTVGNSCMSRQMNSGRL